MDRLTWYIIGRCLSTGAFVGCQIVLAVETGRGTLPASALAAFLVASFGVQFAALPFAGVLTDRVVRSTAAALAYLLQAGVLVGLAIGVSQSQGAFWVCLVAGALIGISLAVNQPALSGLMPELVSSERLQAAHGTMRFWLNLVKVAAPGVVSLALVRVSAGTILRVLAVLLVIAAVQMWLNRSTRPAPTPASILTQAGEGLAVVRSFAWMLPTFVLSGVLTALWVAGYQFLGPLAAPPVLGDEGWGYFVSVLSLGMVAGALLAARRTFARPLIVAGVAAIVWPVALLALAVGPAWTIYCAAFLSGAALDLAAICVDSTVQRLVPEGALGRVNSIQVAIYLAATPLAYLLAFGGQSVAPAETVLAIAGISMLITAMSLLILLMRAFKPSADSGETAVQDVGARVR